MKKILILCLLAISGCTGYSEKDRVDIIVRNDSDTTVTFYATMGIYTRNITLQPKTIDTFWFYKGMISKKVDIKVIKQK